MLFKDRLKMLRKEKKMTQVTLGQMLNYGYTAIANYESGRNNPSIEDLKKIAAIFNVSMDYLLGVNDIRYPYIREDNSNEFNEVRRYYAKLSPKKINELLFFMEWLVARPEEGNMKSEAKKQQTAIYGMPGQREYESLYAAEPTAQYEVSEQSKKESNK
ncbi:helix-turn-helix transcriptional regulator [Lachnospiraceae bacterium 46-61]